MDETALIVITIAFCFGSAIMWVTLFGVCQSESQPGATPDPLTGIRTPATRRSNEAWITAHRVALRQVKPCGLVLGPLALAGLVTLGWSPALAAIWELAVFVACLAWVLVACHNGVLAARRVNQSQGTVRPAH